MFVAIVLANATAAGTLRRLIVFGASVQRNHMLRQQVIPVTHKRQKRPTIRQKRPTNLSASGLSSRIKITSNLDMIALLIFRFSLIVLLLL